jgi:hypothetical protein
MSGEAQGHLERCSGLLGLDSQQVREALCCKVIGNARDLIKSSNSAAEAQVRRSVVK